MKILLMCLMLISNTPKHFGVDLSHHNSINDWNKISVDFIYVKATEGATYKDPKFDYYVTNAKKHNIPIGAYHFFTTSSSGKQQFNNFKKTLSKYNMDLIPVIDIECMSKGHYISKKELQKELRIFVNLCYKTYGKKPIIYSGKGFYLKYLKFKFSDCDFWCGNINEKVYISHIMHQTCIKHVAGINGRVDYIELYYPLKRIKL